jgi:leucyl aminopeptidase
METQVISKIGGELTIVGLFENEELPEQIKSLDEDGVMGKRIEDKIFTGEPRQLNMVNCKSKSFLLVGLGKKEDCSLEIIRRISGHAARSTRDIFGFTKFEVYTHHAEFPNTSLAERAQAVCEGTLLGLYQFLKYITQETDKIKKVSEVSFIGEGIEEAIRRGKILAECAALTRDVINEPPSNLDPQQLAESTKELEKYGVNVTIMDKAQIEQQGLTALLAVNRGSTKEPRFVTMEYNGGGSKKVALVGKGLTFDSGGLNIKPGMAMSDMKMDMGGAATVVGVVKACAMLKSPVHIVGIIGCTENMPGGDAYKPGDVIKAYNGKTIEVLNTDAEGRIVLADCLAYAEKDVQPDAIIDLATLTGACIIALGNISAAVLGDETLVNALGASGKITGDRCWPLPLWPDYQEMVKSEIADVRNIGTKPRNSGTITAAAFLMAFVEKTPWAHLDIAGTAWSDEDKDYLTKGGTGWGVRLLVDFLEKWN